MQLFFTQCRFLALYKQMKPYFYQVQDGKLASSHNESQLECPVVNILLWKQNQEQQDTNQLPWQPVFVYFEKWLLLFVW